MSLNKSLFKLNILFHPICGIFLGGSNRLISELTWNTFRSHLILEYEIPKWDGDIGNPNSFIHLDKSIGTKKIQYLQKAYKSQQGKSWFSHDLFWSIMRLRGMESNSSSEIAEAFYSRKTILKV